MPANVNIERLAQPKVRITELHLPPIPDVPASLLKFPGVKEWNQQLKLMRERDQEQLYRALLNKGGETETSVVNGTPGEKGDKGDTGEDGEDGEQGPPGEDGTDGAAGGAPSAATYIVQVPNASLSNEQALSLLTTGLLKSTTGTGVVSIAAAGTDYQTPLVSGTDYENPLTFTGPLSRLVDAISIPQANGATDGFLDSGDWTIFSSKQDALPVSDATAIVKGSVTASKLLRFEVDGFTAATTRVITPPDADITLAGTNIANTWAVIQTFADEVRVLTHNGSEANTEFSVFNADTSTYTYQVLGSGMVLFGAGTAQIAADGIYTGPRIEAELSLEVQTRAGEETDIEFAVYNLDTTTETFHILGNGSFVADGTATIGSLNGVIIGTAGVLSAVSTLGVGNGGTGAASFGANRVIFQNSANTAFSSDTDFTFATDTLTVTKIAATTITGTMTFADAVNITFNTSTGTMIGTGAAEKIGFWGVTPVVASVDWAPTNVTVDKVFDANSTTLDELSDVVGTLVNVLKVYGLLG